VLGVLDEDRVGEDGVLAPRFQVRDLGLLDGLDVGGDPLQELGALTRGDGAQPEVHAFVVARPGGTLDTLERGIGGEETGDVRSG
jgi:hypothetical protein